MTDNSWTPLNLSCRGSEQLRQAFNIYACTVYESVSLKPESERPNALELARKKVLKKASDLSDNQALIAAINVLTDLVRQGWRIRVCNGSPEVARPVPHLTDPIEEKRRVRNQLHAERDQQLRALAVRSFIRSMEQRQFFNDSFVSIFSLIRDGRELAEQLRALRTINGEASLNSRLDKGYLSILTDCC